MNAMEELNARLGIGQSRPRLPITLQRSGYTAVRQLGKGSFGNAYLVYHAERKEHYVVKHVNMANMTSRQRKDAHQEIALLQQLDYPNIVRYVEFFEEYPHLYIVMEYADGGDVYTHLKNLKRSVWALGGGGAGGANGGAAGLTEEQVISLFVQTTMAVKYMHDRRLLHRDIKSQNVFLTQSQVVKLGDFGISTVLMSTVAMAQTMCGTPCYFSPELCEGKPYNNKSDVWALGVFLYELCTTGRLPFEAITMNRLMGEICKKDPRRVPANFSDELWGLIQWMLKKDPRQRPDAGQILRSPVLVRAIPGIIKKLSFADSRCEQEYGRLFSPDAGPLPPIRPVALQQKQQQHSQQGAGGSNECRKKLLLPSGVDAAMPAAGGAGRFDIPCRKSEEYPFNRINDADPLRKKLDGVCGLLVRHPQLRENTEEEKASPSKAVLAGKPLLAGDGVKCNPVLLQGKLNKEEVNLKDDGGKANNKSDEKNFNCHAVNYFSEGLYNRCANKGKSGEQSVEYGAGRLPESPRQQPSAQAPPQRFPRSPKNSSEKIPLKDLFVIYDEKKKRIQNIMEQRSKLVGGEMNYRPSGKDFAFRRPSAVEGKPEVHALRGVLPAEPCRLIEKKLAAVPIEDKAAQATSDANSQPAENAPNELCELRRYFCNESRRESNNDGDKVSKKDYKASEAAASSGDVALVLREMTIHLQSVQGDVIPTRGNGGGGVVSDTGTPLKSPSAASVAPADPASSHFVGELKQDEGEAWQEFADVMGTTLDVKGLQRKTATVGSTVDVCSAEDGESIPMVLVQNDVLGIPSASPQLSVHVGGFEAVGKGPGRGTEKRLLVETKGPMQVLVPRTSFTGLEMSLVSVANGESGRGPVFEGRCLCNSIHFSGLASSIFGSFVCSCVVCAKVSGAMMGVEWLHLPDVQCEEIFGVSPQSPSLSPAVSPQAARLSYETSLGDGVAAAQVSSGGASPSAVAGDNAAAVGWNVQSQEEVGQKQSGGRVQLPQPLIKFVVDMPFVDEEGTRDTGKYVVYFCSRCGTTLGMDHNDISGSLVAKAALSDVSLVILESFQQTMM